MRRSCLLLAALMLFPANAMATPDRAAGGKAADPQEKFQNMDKNSDGELSREEFFEAYPHMHEAAFKGIDKNGDNIISKEEWMDFSSSHSRDMGGMGGMPMGQPGMGGGPVMREMFREGGEQGEKPGGGKPLFELKRKNETQQ